MYLSVGIPLTTYEINVLCWLYIYKQIFKSKTYFWMLCFQDNKCYSIELLQV